MDGNERMTKHGGGRQGDGWWIRDDCSSRMFQCLTVLLSVRLLPKYPSPTDLWPKSAWLSFGDKLLSKIWGQGCVGMGGRILPLWLGRRRSNSTMPVQPRRCLQVPPEAAPDIPPAAPTDAQHRSKSQPVPEPEPKPEPEPATSQRSSCNRQS